MAHAQIRAHSGPPPKRRFLETVYKRGLNRVTLRFAGRRRSPWAIVRHVGRRSGRSFATPVLASRAGDGVRVLLPFGADTDWCRNVLAAGRFTLRWQGRDYAVEAPQVVETASAWRLVGLRRYLKARQVGPDEAARH